MASSNKRERDLARARHEARRARIASRAEAQRRRQRTVGVVVAVVVVLAGVGWFVAGKRSDTTAAAAPAPTANPAVVAGCTTPVTPTTKSETWTAAPASALVPGDEYTFTLQTNCGQIVISTYPTKAPETVNSQVFLAGKGYFDASSCFRLTTSSPLFVFQCGSGTNTAAGSTGYKLPDENVPADKADNYPAGTVAMANSGPGTAGSQFFITYKTSTLSSAGGGPKPTYTIWGKVVSGLDILQKVAAAGVTGGGTDGTPVQPLVITKATTAHQAAG